MSRARATYELRAEDKSKRAFDSLKRNLGDVGGAFRGLAGLVAGVAGASGLGAMVKSSLDAADAAGKMARTLGVTTEAYTGLSYAAELGGVSNEQFSASMRKLARTAYDAATGSKEAEDAFGALGITVTDSNGQLKSADVLMAEIADRFSQMEDGATKTALAQELMGRSGASLITTLNAGADGLRAATEEAARFGQVLTDETALGAALVNDNLTRMQKAGTGMANQITQGMLPTLANLSQVLVDTAGDTEAMETVSRAAATGLKLLASGVVVAITPFKVLGQAIGSTAAALQALSEGEFRRAWSALSEGGSDMVASVENTLGQLDRVWNDAAGKALISSQTQAEAVRRSVTVTVDLSESAAKSTRKQTDEVGKQISALQQQAATLGLTSAEMQVYELRTKGASEAQIALARDALGTVDAFNRQQELISAGRQVWEDTRTPQEEFNKRLERTMELLRSDALPGGWETASRAITRYREELTAATAETEQAADTMDEFARTAAGNIQTAFADMLSGVGEGLDGLASKFADTLQRMAAELLAQQILREFFGWISGFGGSVGSLGSSLLAGMRADGGPVTGGRTYLVGERGPELFTPSRSGSIAPNESISGGNTRIINVIDPSLVGDYLDSPAGDRTIINTIRRNAGSVRQLIA